MNNLSPNTPFWLRNGHADTIFAKFLQLPSPAYRRELLPDSTGKAQVAYDFVDSPNPDAPLVVLFSRLGRQQPQPLRGRVDVRGTRQRLERRGRPFS